MAESVRLTNDIRASIVKKAITHRFRKPVVELLGIQAALADEVYNEIYGPLTQKRMAELPEGWLGVRSGFTVVFGGAHEQIDFDGDYNLNASLRATVPQNRPRPEPRRFFSVHNSHHTPIRVYEARHPLSEKYQTNEAKRSDLMKQVAEAEKALKAALESVTTVGRLLAVWPELKPFCTDLLAAKVPNLPAVPRERLNALLDLPV